MTLASIDGYTSLVRPSLLLRRIQAGVIERALLAGGGRRLKVVRGGIVEGEITHGALLVALVARQSDPATSKLPAVRCIDCGVWRLCRTFGAALKTKRCDPCRLARRRRHTGLTAHAVCSCGRKMSKRSTKCIECVRPDNAARAALLGKRAREPKVGLTCSCGRALGRANTSGSCKPCYSASRSLTPMQRKERARVAQARRFARDPAAKQKNTDRVKERYHSDAEYRERVIERAKARYRAKKAGF